MVRTKVFVGNLSFKTTDKDLSKEFEVAGKVATANIISRGSRSLGYGFVEMESEEEAKRSVELLNKKIIDTREINVEIARPREDRAPAPTGEGSPAPATGGDGAPARRRRGGRRAPGAAVGSPATTTPAAGDLSAPVVTIVSAKRTRAPRNKKPAGEAKTGGEVGTATAGGEAKTGGEAGAPRTRKPRAPRPPREDTAERTPSTTTLFVANLPFTVDDAQLAEIFKGLSVKSAHVVRKQNNNTKSKGFGFVEFNTEGDQLKALDAINKTKVGERELSVKVALAEAARAAEATTDAGAVPAGLPAVPAPGVAATAESK